MQEQSQISAQDIRVQIQETRTAIADKAEALQTEVRETVDQATEIVNDQIERVKESFSLSHQVQRHPWQALGIAVAAGLLLERVLAQPELRPAKEAASLPTPPQTTTSRLETRSADPSPTLLSRVAESLDFDLTQVKRAAIGTGLAMLSEFVQRKLPKAPTS